jgi:hypothetical protein
MNPKKGVWCQPVAGVRLDEVGYAATAIHQAGLLHGKIHRFDRSADLRVFLDAHPQAPFFWAGDLGQRLPLHWSLHFGSPAVLCGGGRGACLPGEPRREFKAI